MSDIILVVRAADFAARAHAAQRRKGAGEAPYIQHLTDVARRVAEALPADAVLIAAAYLHDTIEDVGVTAADLEAAFGPDVAALVLELTDDKSLPKAERKRLQIAEAPRTSPRAAALKLADKASNVADLRQGAPPDWSVERILAFADHAEAVALNLPPAPALLVDGLAAEIRALRDAHAPVARP